MFSSAFNGYAFIRLEAIPPAKLKAGRLDVILRVARCAAVVAPEIRTAPKVRCHNWFPKYFKRCEALALGLAGLVPALAAALVLAVAVVLCAPTG